MFKKSTISFGKLSLMFVVTWCLVSCASVKSTPEFETVKGSHQTTAILPVIISLDNAKLPKNMNRSKLDSLERAEGYRYQIEIYKYLEAHRKKGKLNIAIQHPDETNQKLKQLETHGSIKENTSASKLTSALGTDSYMQISFDVSFISSDATAAVVMALSPFQIATKETIVNYEIKIPESANTAWSYHQALRSGAFISTASHEELVYSKILKRIPYKKAPSKPTPKPAI